MYHGGEAVKKVNPREKANFFSLVTFLFSLDLLKKGYRKDITEDDIYQVPRKLRSRDVGNLVEKEWQKEMAKTKPSLFNLFWACWGKYYLTLGVIQLAVKIFMVMVVPKILSRIVSYFSAHSQMSKTDLIYNAMLLVIINIVNSTYEHNYSFLITELGIRIKTGICSLIYRKCLKVTTSTLSEIGIGRILTIISKDVIIMETAVLFLNDIWGGLFILLITFGLMYSKVGISALSGILFLLVIIPLQILLGKLTSVLRKKASKVTDYRLQVTQETLSAIKIIKMYTWERFFSDKISKARNKEMKKVREIFWTKATSLVIGGVVVNLTQYIIVITYISLGYNFTAEVWFYITECLRTLRPTVAFAVPIGIAQTAELVTSLGRIYKVLLAKEAQQTRQKADKPKIEMNDVSVVINQTEVLNKVNLKIDSGLNFVIGKLGSGKSSLLKTILEDYPIVEGKINIKGTISYASEEPWLFPSTIRQNILFGEEFNEERYRKVVKVCALEIDINRFENGDQTLVDDKGMNLSKGQQARIGLARAIYRDSDIYLLDDCLSSVDAHVQKFVFNECIRTFLKDKIVIMISSNEHQAKEADNVILMESGTVKGSWKSSDAPLDELIIENDNENDIIDNIAKEEEEAGEDTELLKKNYENIYREVKQEGKVALKVYLEYAKFGGGLLVLIPFFAFFIGAEFVNMSSHKLSTNWITIQQNISDIKFSSSNASLLEPLEAKNKRIFNIYSLAVAVATGMLLTRAFAHFSIGVKSSIALHKRMALSVIHTTLSFFDTHYIGNVLNRFSKDMTAIDEFLPLNFYEIINFVLRSLGMLLLILSVNKFFIVPAVIIFIVLYFLRRWYIPTGRSLKRLDSATRSPMVGHINASLEGLATIRAYHRQAILKEEFDRHQDLYTSTFYMTQCASKAFAYFLDMCCNFFVIVIVFRFVFFPKDTLVGDVGLAITQAIGLTEIIQWGIRQWAELESQMTSVERVLEYTKVGKENKSGQIVENWPNQGAISFEDVSLVYGSSKKFVLKDLSFSISPQEKIGIVGRTGAGKSSLISVLFRLYQYTGTIRIDGVDTRTLSLDLLRSNIVIIPQDPVLFTGTIRTNIDPMGIYSDEEIWKALNHAHLNNIVSSLDYKISETGCYFSAGQKQLICLARAIISKKKLIVLDEATANVDPETDVLIYSTIQESFVNCTVLTIAHRLHTVLYSDKVMVVDHGQIVEFDDPNTLLENKDGIFYKMIEQANLTT